MSFLGGMDWGLGGRLRDEGGVTVDVDIPVFEVTIEILSSVEVESA